MTAAILNAKASSLESYRYRSVGDRQPLPRNEADQQTQLVSVLAHCEQVRTEVVQCAEELATVNLAVRQLLASLDPALAAVALHEGAAVQHRIGQAVASLDKLTLALHAEARDRELLDHRFAAALEQQEAAHHAALHDALTGLPNRVLFRDRLEHGLAQAGRHRRSLAVMYVDLDGFKKINDSYGHEIGDGVLRIIAKRLSDATRGEDTVGRNGGDEFLCLLQETHQRDHLAQIAQRMIKAIRAPCRVHAGSRECIASVSVSIGIAIFPEDGNSIELLLRSADEAMYRAKLAQSGFAFSERQLPVGGVDEYPDQACGVPRDAA